MSDISEIINLIEKQGTDFSTWKSKQDGKISELEADMKEIVLKSGRQKLSGNGSTASEIKHLKTADGRQLPMLRTEQKFADMFRGDEKSEFNLGEFCKDSICGSTKASSGPALVPNAIGSQIIDMVRAQTVIVEAGAGTIGISGPTNLAQLTSGPTVHQHTEAVVDISESDIIASPITLNPKLLAVLVPLSVELVQDSPNLDALITTALAGAFAAKLDGMCIATLLADANIPKSLATQDPALWEKVLEAVGSALGLNQRLPTSHVSAPEDFIGRASQLATTGSWLGAPPVLSRMLELQTSGLTAGTALFGNFAEAFAIALRSELRVEVVRHAKPTSASHLLVAHLRADGVVLQPGKLFKQLKTVV